MECLGRLTCSEAGKIFHEPAFPSLIFIVVSLCGPSGCQAYCRNIGRADYRNRPGLLGRKRARKCLARLLQPWRYPSGRESRIERAPARARASRRPLVRCVFEQGAPAIAIDVVEMSPAKSSKEGTRYRCENVKASSDIFSIHPS